MTILSKKFKLILTLCCITLLAACASTRTSTGLINDPLESINRPIFAFNSAIDKAILSPASKVYAENMPKPVKKGVRNFLKNLREPWTFINDLLQFKFDRAANTFSRFAINTTFGIGGLWNVAKKAGLDRHKEDFGQTLATWGVKGGPYLVLPILGPSTVRGAVGSGVEFFAEPVGYYADEKNKEMWNYGRIIMDKFTTRVEFRLALDNMYLENDPYIFARSAYLQSRAYDIRDGAPAPMSDEDDLFDFDDEDEGQ